MSDFFAMGGYAAYVWPSFALTAIVMFLNLYFAKRRRSKVIARLQRENAALSTGDGTAGDGTASDRTVNNGTGNASGTVTTGKGTD